MLTINKISVPSSKVYNSSYTTFKSTKEEKIKKFQTEQAKRDYVASKTETIENLADLTLISSLFLNAHNISFKEKLKTKEWFALGLFATAVASIITLFIKKAQYAKEYDKEINA